MKLLHRLINVMLATTLLANMSTYAQVTTESPTNNPTAPKQERSAEPVTEAPAPQKEQELNKEKQEQAPSEQIENVDFLVAQFQEALANGNECEANILLDKLVKQKELNAYHYNSIGYALTNYTSRYAEALRALNYALKLMPNDIYILDSKAWALARSGKLNAAKKIFLAIHKRFDKDSEPYAEVNAHLAYVYAKLGQQKQAKAFWKKALTVSNFPKEAALVAHLLGWDKKNTPKK